MRYRGWLFDIAESWRSEAAVVRERYEAMNIPATLEAAAEDLESALHSFIARRYTRDEVSELTGYSRRQVDRWIEDGIVRADENGQIAVLDLPVKPGQLPRLLGLGPARKSRAADAIELDQERERRRRPWKKTPAHPPAAG